MAAVSRVRRPDTAARTRPIRILAKQVKAKVPTFEQLFDFLGPDLFPAMIWLCAGLVAAVGNSDVDWLRQFRTEPNT